MRHMLNFGFSTEFELNEQDVLIINEDCAHSPHELEIHSIPSMQRLCRKDVSMALLLFVCFRL